MRLARINISRGIKNAGISAGMFGGTAAFGLVGLMALAFTVGAVLSLFLPAWLAGLIVTVLFFAIAGILAEMTTPGVAFLMLLSLMPPSLLPIGIVGALGAVLGRRALERFTEAGCIRADVRCVSYQGYLDETSVSPLPASAGG